VVIDVTTGAYKQPSNYLPLKDYYPAYYPWDYYPWSYYPCGYYPCYCAQSTSSAENNQGKPSCQDHKDWIFDGDHKEEILDGDHKKENPDGDRKDWIPGGDHKEEILDENHKDWIHDEDTKMRFQGETRIRG
jgi:hypothetical protein